jgi:serine/threonine protein kinase
LTTSNSATSEDRIGDYRIVRALHAGVTAVVFEVVQESTQRRYVVKQLLESRAGDAAERKSFAFEAKLGMELRHPNLVRVVEYVKDRDQPYFVMDYFPSYHLRLPIAKPSVYPMPKLQLHRIMRQSASALGYMHDQGWIHRDVKPENILVNKSGEVRVIDYTIAMRPRSGLSKLFGGKIPRQGTSSYMSPEQIRCEPPAPTADIYSFGITCYELACGRPPFRANSQQELLSKHLRERPVPLTTHNPLVTPEFNDLVMKMIQKRPEDRIESFHEFLTRFRSVRVYRDDPDPLSD